MRNGHKGDACKNKKAKNDDSGAGIVNTDKPVFEPALLNFGNFVAGQGVHTLL